VEVKSGGSISNTEQLRETGQAAMDATGKPLKVVTTNPNANVANTVKNNENLELHQLNKKNEKRIGNETVFAAILD